MGTDGSHTVICLLHKLLSRPCGDGWSYIDDAPRIVNDCPVHTWTDGSSLHPTSSPTNGSRPYGDG